MLNITRMLYVLVLFVSVVRSDMLEQDNCTCIPYHLCDPDPEARVIDISRREGKCPHYLDVCCKTPPVEKPTEQTPLPSLGCGRRNNNGVGARIMGDKHGETQFAELPWMVMLLKESDGTNGAVMNLYVCGASLIHPQVVMTAAHCISNNTKYKVRAGEWDSQTSNEIYPHVDMDVDSIAIHPDYVPGSLQNDIALLYLSSALQIKYHINTICLPTHNVNVDGSKCVASGWGKSAFGNDGQYQNILKKVDLPIVSNERCQDSLRATRLGAFFHLHSSFMCAGGEDGKDMCEGDGGSPLVCPLADNPSQYVQVGIVAWGINCGQHATPGVYVNVARFTDWIDGQVSAVQDKNNERSVTQLTQYNN